MLHYQKAGSGFPVVLLHGFCENNTCFNRQVLLLKDHFTIITPSLPGTTATDLPFVNTLDDMADEVYRLLDSLNINQCMMLGHSMGGYVTLAFAQKYPALLRGFGLIHSSALADDDARKEKREQAKRVIETKGGPFFAKGFIPGLFAPNANPTVVAELTETADLLSSEGLVNQVAAMKTRPDRTSVIKEWKHPVFWAIGKHDALLPEDILFKQALSGNAAYIAYLSQSAHMGHVEQPNELAHHIIQFSKTLAD